VSLHDSTLVLRRGKAAVDMFFRVLAAENPDIRVLNYAPGPMKTEMTDEIRWKSSDIEIRSLFETNSFVDKYDSARKLIQILDEDRFESGSHVDYFD